MVEIRTTRVLLLGLVVVTGYGCYLLIAPFLKAILFASVTAVLLYPLYRKMRRSVTNRNVASLLATLAVVSLAAVCSMLLGHALAREIHEIYDLLHANGNGREHLGAYLLSLTEGAAVFAARYLPLSALDVRATVTAESHNLVTAIVNSAGAFVRGVGAFVGNAAVCFFILFFFFRDGRRMIRRVCAWLPLRIEQSKRLLRRIEQTLRAVVYGTLAIAALQGALTGTAFWILGLTSPVLWTIITAICALIPVIGTGFVLFPAVAMLVFSGHWVKALLLLAWGLLIVHPIDNVFRPYLIGNKTELSTLFVFFSLLGGLRVFGAAGIFLGPVILSAALALFGFLREEARRGTLGLGLSPLRFRTAASSSATQARIRTRAQV